MRLAYPKTFEQWRTIARQFISADIPPEDILWHSESDQLSLFEDDAKTQDRDDLKQSSLESASVSNSFRVPKDFLALARDVACHRESHRWSLLYRLLWRIVREQKELLKNPVDEDVCQARQMQKAVSRDCHKMKAFVRFRRVPNDPHADGLAVADLDLSDASPDEHYIAWHRPDHLIVRLVAPFFQRRFPCMNWSMLTPQESVHWDQKNLVYSEGVPASEAPTSDQLEELWLTYYSSIFNPARIKLRAMTAEMPVRHWPTLPETEVIADLLQTAPSRVAEMVRRTEGFKTTAAEFLPGDRSLASLAKAASICTACDLHQDATQTVFGEGNPEARIVMIGEQPGDREDLEGQPFIGPAGQLLDEVLNNLQVSREDVYITNVVKHFKFTQQGNRRLHKKPGSREIFACRPWLEAELTTIKPQALVCLGATPAQALLGRDFRITRQRGEVMKTEWCNRTIATWHPAAVLRMPDPQRRGQMIEELTSDIATIL